MHNWIILIISVIVLGITKYFAGPPSLNVVCLLNNSFSIISSSFVNIFFKCFINSSLIIFASTNLFEKLFILFNSFIYIDVFYKYVKNKKKK